MAVGPERRVNQLNVVGHATVLPLIAIPGPLKEKKHQDFIGCPRIVGDQTTTAKEPQRFSGVKIQYASSKEMTSVGFQLIFKEGLGVGDGDRKSVV